MTRIERSSREYKAGYQTGWSAGKRNGNTTIVAASEFVTAARELSQLLRDAGLVGMTVTSTGQFSFITRSIQDNKEAL